MTRTHGRNETANFAITGPRFEHLQDVRRTAARLEREWMRKIPEDDRRATGWMPFPIPAFTELLDEALPEAPGNRFLGIGSGIGTKEWLARERDGWDVHGIERVPEYAAQAESLGVPTLIMDAADFGHYGDFDLIWFHRPFRDPDSQAALEKRVWDDMAPGAVVICAHLEGMPPGWVTILDDLEARRGIWMKPTPP